MVKREIDLGLMRSNISQMYKNQQTVAIHNHIVNLISIYEQFAADNSILMSLVKMKKITTLVNLIKYDDDNDVNVDNGVNVDNDDTVETERFVMALLD